MAHLLEPFGVNIGYHDPFADVPGYTRLELDDLMGWADIITLHCPKTENGAPLLDLGRLSLMRPGSFILNIARGAHRRKGSPRPAHRRASGGRGPRLLRQGTL